MWVDMLLWEWGRGGFMENGVSLLVTTTKQKKGGTQDVLFHLCHCTH